MKIEGGNKNPIDLQKVKSQKQQEVKENKLAGQTARSPDQVSAKLSQTLSAITKEIEESGLTAGEVHSVIDEDRAIALLESFDRVGEGKQPTLPAEDLLEMADKLSAQFDQSPEFALSAFNAPDRNRVQDLL